MRTLILLVGLLVLATAAGAATDAVKFQAEMRIAAKKHNLDVALLESLVHEESGFDKNAFGKKHQEIGLAQIQLPTWKYFRCKGIPWLPQDNLNCAAKILKDRVRVCGGIAQGLASYNAGSSRCPTTKRGYVQRITARWYRMLFVREFERRVALR